MADFQLGERVGIIDRMLRCNIDLNRGVRAVKELWPDYPADALIGDRGLEGRIQEARVWLPLSIVKQLQSQRVYPTVLSNRNTPGLVEEPSAGIVTRKLTLTNGIVGGYYEGAVYHQAPTTFTGYEVTYSLHRRPLTVSAKQIKPLQNYAEGEVPF